MWPYQADRPRHARAWPSTAASDRGLGRPVAGRGRARIRGLQDKRKQSAYYEMVTTRMQPSVIVWDLETVPDLAGFAAANASSARGLSVTNFRSTSTTRLCASEH